VRRIGCWPHIVAVPGHLQPRDANDTFCTCPRCECLGHHPITEHGHYRPNLLADADGRLTIEASGFGQRTSGPYTERTCTFCKFTWRSSENYAPEE
jgi:hypothetical protein